MSQTSVVTVGFGDTGRYQAGIRIFKMWKVEENVEVFIFMSSLKGMTYSMVSFIINIISSLSMAGSDSFSWRYLKKAS